MTTTALSLPSAYEGIYEVAECAEYIYASRKATNVYGVNSRQLIRWIRNGLTDPNLIHVLGRDLLLTFEDLISMRIVAALRSAGVSWRKIHDAKQWLREYTGTRRPFATESLWTERSEVFVEFKTRIISASRHGQAAFDLLREYLIPIHGLHFSEDRMAETWEPVAGILLDPSVQFGAPCFKGTRIPTAALAGMVSAGDSVQRLVRSYRISEDEVLATVQWEEARSAS